MVKIKDNQFTFNNISSLDFHILLSGYGTYAVPAKDVSMITIPGRSGDLTLDNNRFNNVDITYKALIYDNLNDNYKAFTGAMMSQTGYKRLEDTFHPEEYRLAVFKEAIEPKLHGYEAAGFEITFNCKPQRFLKSGEEILEVTTSGVVFNPTNFESRPLFRAYGNGTLTINNRVLTITGISDYIDIDTDMMNAFKGSTNMNSYISGDFPLLDPGENEITFTGTKIEIEPRWYIL